MAVHGGISVLVFSLYRRIAWTLSLKMGVQGYASGSVVLIAATTCALPVSLSACPLFTIIIAMVLRDRFY